MARSCALLISTYNWPQALALVLDTVCKQSVLPSEVVIADDGSTSETSELIKSYQSKLNIKHIWHEDDGFRKTIIMNKAVNAITEDYIIQIDGDMLLHPDFIKDHLSFAKQNHFIKGSRAMLPETISNEIIQSKTVKILELKQYVKSKINATRFPLLAPIFFGNKKRSDNLRGCNFAFWKKDFIAVNGYNNDLLGWGHEDIELAARLVNNGVNRRQLKMVAVCFHLYHKLNNRAMEDSNYKVYLSTVKNNIIYIPNGFNQ